MPLTKINYNQVKGAPINVLDYGADSTGVADSTSAITAAWAAATGEVIYPVGTYKVTQLSHPNKALVHRGQGQAATIILGSGAIVVNFPFTSANSQGSVIDSLSIYGNGTANSGASSGTNICLRIDNMGVDLRNVNFLYGDIGIAAHTGVGARWDHVIAYGKTAGVKFYVPTPTTSGQGFWYEAVCTYMTCSTDNLSTTGTGFSVAAGIEFAGNVFEALSSEYNGNGIVLLGDDANSTGNTFIQPWVERINAGGKAYQDTMPGNIYINPHTQGTGSFDLGSGLQISNGNFTKTVFGASSLNIGAITVPSASVYKWVGVNLYAALAAAIRRTLWASNSFYVAGTASYTTETAQAQDEQIITTNGNITGTNDIANIVISPAGDVETLHLEVEFAGASTASGSGYGVYKRVLTWNAVNTYAAVTVGTDVDSGATMTLTNVGGATRTVKISVNVGAGNYRMTTRIRAFCGMSANAALGVSIVSLI